MKKNNLVVFKGKKDGITVLLDEAAEFPTIIDALDKKVIDARKFFGGGKTAISFTGRSLSEEEERQLLDIIVKNADVDISFVSNALAKSDTSSFTLETGTLGMDMPLLLSEHATKYHNGSLRSGQVISYSGSVVVIGDVNPGAQIIARGNILVLGAAQGLLHAGCTGSTECFIFAARLFPIQLRIAHVMTFLPKEMNGDKKNNASYAYIKNGQIYIAPLLNS